MQGLTRKDLNTHLKPEVERNSRQNPGTKITQGTILTEVHKTVQDTSSSSIQTVQDTSSSEFWEED